MRQPLLSAKIAAARAVGSLARGAGRGGGTSLPGKVLMRLQPDAISRLARRLPQGTVMLSATNGKTTTAAMVATVLEQAGLTLVHNRAGANMAGGVASTLLRAARPGGSIAGQLGLFEVDEFWLDRLAPELRPRAVLLANLFRDQLDRYGELETIADRWAAAVARLPDTTALVLNADDPLVADLGRKRPQAIHFGVEDDSVALAGMQHAADSKHCRRCGHAYAYSVVLLGHLGHYRCPNCGQERPRPTITATQITLQGTRGATFALTTPQGSERIELPLPGLYNVYNALAAAALCTALEVPFGVITAGLRSATAAFGRAESVELGDVQATILLVKNPAGANEVLRTLALEGRELELLAVLNDGIADGRDVSWVWDADFELLVDRVRRVTCSGTRAAELAVRLKYAGIAAERLEVVGNLEAALDRAVASAQGSQLYALPTYTALLELRELLARRGHVRRFWQQGSRAA